MNHSIASKHYKINGSPLHMKKNPLNYQYISTRNAGAPESFQTSINLHNNNQILYPRKPPGFNLSKSQEMLPKPMKKPEFMSNAKIVIKQVNNGIDNNIGFIRDSKGFMSNSLQSKKSPNIALKLPKINTPEDQRARIKANSVGRPANGKDNKTSKEKENEKKEIFNENQVAAYKPIDIKKQKRLSDAGNIGFIIPPNSIEEGKKLQPKPHANSYTQENTVISIYINLSLGKGLILENYT